MQDYRNLRVAELARGVAVQTYRLTALFPVSERYGLARQMQRAAVSVGSNIAEGAGRPTDRDFKRFLGIAFGSANELEFQTRLAVDLDFASPAAASQLLERIQDLKKSLSGLIAYLKHADAAV